MAKAKSRRRDGLSPEEVAEARRKADEKLRANGIDTPDYPSKGNISWAVEAQMVRDSGFED